MKKIGLLTNIVSPHQLPLAKAIADLIGPGNYRYVYTEEFHAERAKMGWCDDVAGLGFSVCKYDDESREWLARADLVYCEERAFDLIEARLKAGKKTFYVSERWLKPIAIADKIPHLFPIPYSLFPKLPGWLRLLHPHYFKMVRRFVHLFDYPDFRYLPQGKWAEKDMALLCRVMGRTMPPEKVVPWGYFVEKGIGNREQGIGVDGRSLRVLWVGRMIGWKRVDTIIRAVAEVAKSGTSITCTLVGSGIKKSELIKLARKLEKCVSNSTVHLHLSPSPIFTFKDSIPIAKIRDEMRANDVYVLSSNGEEGWGAALNEAMEEGMLALGTFEAGSSSYMLPDSHKFHASDWRRLADLLRQAAEGKLARVPIGDWTAEKAAERMLEMI